MSQEKIYQIKNMGFPTEIRNILDRHHIWSSYTLSQMTYEQVLSLKGILPEHMSTIEKTLLQFGLHFIDYSPDHTEGEDAPADEDSANEDPDDSIDDWPDDDFLDWDDLSYILEQEQSDSSEEMEDDPNAKSIELKISTRVSKLPYPENLINDLFDGEFIKRKSVTWDDIASGLACALSTVKPQDADVILLRYKYSLSYESIGRFYGCSASKVGEKLKRGLRYLRHPFRSRMYVKGLSYYFQTQRAVRKEGTEQKAYVRGYYQAAAEIYARRELQSLIPIEELQFSDKTYFYIRHCGIQDISAVMKSFINRDRFCYRRLPVSCRKEVDETLQDLIPNWLEICAAFDNASNESIPIKATLISSFPVSLKPPVYSSYTDKTEGFHLFVTVENNNDDVIEISLNEFVVYHNNRQWRYSSGLSAYGQNESNIYPKCAKTFAKIWSGSDWKEERLKNGDYVLFSFFCGKYEYIYKFILNDNQWILDYSHCLSKKND